MTCTLDLFLASHPRLMAETHSGGASGQRQFELALPAMPAERSFAGARLVLPKGFPLVRARLQLSADAVLRIPHLDSSGDLCFSGDAGPASGASPEERLDDMLFRFYDEFLVPWLSGKLDGDFEDETANYWAIHVTRNASSVDAIRRVYTVDERAASPRVYAAKLLQPSRILIAGEDDKLASRLIESLGPRAGQITNAAVADIPIDHPFTPTTWPASVADVESLLASRLSPQQRRRFTQSASRRSQHRVVLFRAPTCTYAYLLPGGPPMQVVKLRARRAYFTRSLLPLTVERVDPSWTCGRDQHTSVSLRQHVHVLVLGAGALGSAVIDLLARSGVGHMMVVDPDYLSSANIGRHLLGAEDLGFPKAKSLALHVGRAVPSTHIESFGQTAESWLGRFGLADVDVVLDLTGEPEVRAAVESARLHNQRPLLIGWLEPYVAAAHACVLSSGQYWLNGRPDGLIDCQAIDWPPGVTQREPGCSSSFQSYTPVQATHAIGLVAEAALDLIDGNVERSHLRSWVRGQHFLDAQYPGLALRPWARLATELDGVLIQRPWP